MDSVLILVRINNKNYNFFIKLFLNLYATNPIFNGGVAQPWQFFATAWFILNNLGAFYFYSIFSLFFSKIYTQIGAQCLYMHLFHLFLFIECILLILLYANLKIAIKALNYE